MWQGICRIKWSYEKKKKKRIFRINDSYFMYGKFQKAKGKK